MRNIAKWRCQLTEYDIEYVSCTSVKGQEIADHLAEFPIEDNTLINFDFPNEGIFQLDSKEDKPTKGRLPFHQQRGQIRGMHPWPAGGDRFQSEGARGVWGFHAHNFPNAGPMENEGRVASAIPRVSREKLAENFEKILFTYTPLIKNQFADALAILASMCPTFANSHYRKTLRRLAAHYFPSGETLYCRSFNATLLRCVDENEAQRLMGEMHEGSCEPHMNGLMLAKKLMSLGYFWSTKETDCVKHVRHCYLCQVYADQIKAPPNELHLMAAPWPFSMWGIDVIGHINPKASNEHLFIWWQSTTSPSGSRS
ncbi:hypothetical protein CRG98_030355 [Punica granatum]|uniref:Integrase zinc-binding domain-containing protein n=1 Tax=Punica granatum TaxID=22663 RepID=A0A2I0J0N2_PUNGR|nr:hypothetical protein CRG98_030355 [Punica granatum]